MRAKMGTSPSPLKGYLVSTDRVIIKGFNFTSQGETTLEWVSPEREAEIAATKFTAFRLADPGEFLYWDGQHRIMTGIVELAEVFDSADAAESGAFIASAFDPNLAGHLHVVEKDVAFKREKENIERRAQMEVERKKFQENRFKLGGGEGGGI